MKKYVIYVLVICLFLCAGCRKETARREQDTEQLTESDEQDCATDDAYDEDSSDVVSEEVSDDGKDTWTDEASDDKEDARTDEVSDDEEASQSDDTSEDTGSDNADNEQNEGDTADDTPGHDNSEWIGGDF